MGKSFYSITQPTRGRIIALLVPPLATPLGATVMHGLRQARSERVPLGRN